MDYEKKYKDAVARMDLCVRTGLKITPEYIFPEFKESEDERIRKELIGMVKFHCADEHLDRYLNWLEKQKEQTWIPTDEQRTALGMVLKHSDPDADSTKVLESLLDELTKIANPKVAKWKEKQKEQKPAESHSSCLESEHDKEYREGVRYALGKTEQYTIGSTFMGLIPCWVNAPSELQSAHKYHGKNAVIMHENNGGFRCCFIDDEEATTVHLPEDTLFVEGWRKKPADRFEEAREKYQVEWSKDDEAAYDAFMCCVVYLLT